MLEKETKIYNEKEIPKLHPVFSLQRCHKEYDIRLFILLKKWFCCFSQGSQYTAVDIRKN